jgi:hypothetical protein
MIEGIFRQINDLESFLEILESRFNIEGKQYYFIIEDLKKEAFMSNPHLIFCG